jgi:opacity protein-like surface antigen
MKGAFIHLEAEMLKRSVGVLVTLSAICAAPLSAQDASVEALTGWGISMGFDPFAHTNGSLFSENLAGSITRDWSRANSGLGLRAQLSAGSMPRTNLFLGGQCTDCVVSTRRSYVELNATAKYTFRRNRNLRPYLLAGPGLYGVRSEYAVQGAVLGDPDDNSAVVWSMGITAGAGLNFHAFGKNLFLEQRFFIPEASTARARTYVRPFTLGIRF